MGHIWKSLILNSKSCSEIEALVAKTCPSKITVAPTHGFFYQIDTLDYTLFKSGAVLLGYQSKQALTVGYHSSKTSLLIDVDPAKQQWLDPFQVFPIRAAQEISDRINNRALLLQNKIAAQGTRLALLDEYDAIYGHLWLIGTDDSRGCNLFLFGKRGYDKPLKRFLKTLRYSLGLSKTEFCQISSLLALTSSLYPNAEDHGEITYSQQPTTVVISELLLKSLNRVRANFIWIDPHPDPEFLHDLRTAMRQAQAILNYFESSIIQIGIETFQSELAYFLKQTSKPRNFEVLEMKLREMTDNNTGQPSYPRILKHFEEETELHYQHLAGELASPRFEVFLAEWSRIAGRASSISLKLSYSQEPAVSSPQSPLTKNNHSNASAADQIFAQAMTGITSTLECELNQQLRQISKLKSVKKLHDIRKNFRNYKYLTEMVLYAWDLNNFSTSFPKIKKLVGWLGDLRDLYLEERLVRKLECQDPQCREEVAQLSALLNSEYRSQFVQIRKRLKTFDRIDLGIHTQMISPSQKVDTR